MQRLQVRFTGRVQGVGFRATTAHIAASHAVTGWVSNEPDGTVSAQVQGEAPVVRAFLNDVEERMHRNITAIDTSPAMVVDGEHGFHIR